MSRLAGRAYGCAALLFILGAGSFVLPLFGYQFRAVASLEKDMGISMPLAGGVLMAAGLIVSVAVAIATGLGMGLSTTVHTPFGNSPPVTPQVLQRVIPFLPEVSRRLRQGEDILAISESIASRSTIPPGQVFLAIRQLGPAARQKESSQ